MAFWLARCGIVAIDPICKSNHHLTSGTLHAPTRHVGQLNVWTVRFYCWLHKLALALLLTTMTSLAITSPLAVDDVWRGKILMRRSAPQLYIMQHGLMYRLGQVFENGLYDRGLVEAIQRVELNAEIIIALTLVMFILLIRYRFCSSLCPNNVTHL